MFTSSNDELFYAVAVPDAHMIKHIREHNAKENKEVVDISLDIGFPIGAKPSGLEEAEAESDVRMVITPFDFQAGYNSDTCFKFKMHAVSAGDKRSIRYIL